ncbi:acyl-CoA thioesterase [Saccharicrinis fermentans]|uniref:Acyl-CoA thioester hydrolase YbgC n=1 Tax=Saccharicrinis fermentans DSM 9555 = JCM 21142 TaxID=869213 RepID=W7YS72_9BACT|nr:thioesterase family protein [Saccharicrinis fermentans]GAF05304.1 acyl-CoA thioester hydrolase YbgC [Saccharicrinis fermentans DSM 9555 = JCM 21142]
MIVDHFQIRPRYNEVDRMGYVYHANHVTYCHQARTELMRKYELHDDLLEKKGYMLPVISFHIEYKTPARYDEVLTITTKICELPRVRFCMEFEIKNSDGKIVSKGTSEVVFVDKESRLPMAVPEFARQRLSRAFVDDLIGQRAAHC